MYKADGKRLDQMTAEELAKLPNFYNDEKPEKYLKLQKSQAELTELTNDKNIQLDRFMREVCPHGFFWVMVNGTMMDHPLSWTPSYVNFTDACYREFGGLLHSIVEIHPQGLLCIDYKNPEKVERFVNAMAGGASRSRLHTLFGF